MGDGIDRKKNSNEVSSALTGLSDRLRSSHQQLVDEQGNKSVSEKNNAKVQESKSVPVTANPDSQEVSGQENKAKAQQAPTEALPPSRLMQSVPESSGLQIVTGQGVALDGKRESIVSQEPGVSVKQGNETATRAEERESSKLSSQQSLFPESLTNARNQESASSLLITPIHNENYVDTPRNVLGDSRASAPETVNAASHTPPGKTTFGELAAKLNQSEAQPSVATPIRSPEIAAPKHSEAPQLLDRTPLANSSSTEAQKTPVSTAQLGGALDRSDQSTRREVAPANPASQSQSAPAEVNRSTVVNPAPTLQGHISNTQDVSASVGASRIASSQPDRTAASDNARNEIQAKAQSGNSSPADRVGKVDPGKIDTIDARTKNSEPSVTSSPDSGAIKSSRVESISTDRVGKTDKTEAGKPHDDTKGRAEISNSSKREPLIIPGVITSRTSDSVGGGKGSKSDGKTDGKVADTKTSGTTSDASAGKKDIGKADKTGEKADQHGDTKVAATNSNVISGVAGRIMDGISNIKGILTPGARPNAESTTGKIDPRVEHMDHLTQPKPIDATVAVGKDLKATNPAGASTEFTINSKKEISDPREETLSSKAGGLKQALQQIFGSHPDINADLKANVFPGPKTVAFENVPLKPGEKPNQVAIDNANKSADAKTVRVDDPGYLRNQKGDKVSTGDLRQELADLKASGGKLRPEETTAEEEAAKSDLKNRQQIKDFTVQLGEIANLANSVPNPENIARQQSSLQVDEARSDDDDFDTRYLYYVKEGDTLRSIFDTQVPHEIGNTASFEYFVKINEQTIRLSSVLAADGMSLVLRVGTVLKLPTPKQLASLKSI